MGGFWHLFLWPYCTFGAFMLAHWLTRTVPPFKLARLIAYAVSPLLVLGALEGTFGSHLLGWKCLFLVTVLNVVAGSILARGTLRVDPGDVRKTVAALHAASRR